MISANKSTYSLNRASQFLILLSSSYPCGYCQQHQKPRNCAEQIFCPNLSTISQRHGYIQIKPLPNLQEPSELHKLLINFISNISLTISLEADIYMKKRIVTMYSCQLQKYFQYTNTKLFLDSISTFHQHLAPFSIKFSICDNLSFRNEKTSCREHFKCSEIPTVIQMIYKVIIQEKAKNPEFSSSQTQGKYVEMVMGGCRFVEKQLLEWRVKQRSNK